jgi:glycerate 2-kinase
MFRIERQLRRDALKIFRAALGAANVRVGVREHVRVNGDRLTVGKRRYLLNRFRRIFVIGAGKASAEMALALEALLGRRIAGGLINVKYGHTARLRRIDLNECGHPVPDEAGVRGAQRIAQIARDAGEDDLVICLISGGASALLPMPAAGLTLEEEQRTTELLIACGASIHEINAVRKHISGIKGGQLARLCWPAAVISLIVSDVVGDDLDTIGSGPTAPDRSTFADARAVLARYAIENRVPAAVRARLREGAEETPKPGDAIFSRVQNAIVVSNRLALQAAAKQARTLGYRTMILSTTIEGETRDVARVHAAIAKEICASGHPLKPPACVISGGETTVTLRGNGTGGRNQEFALAAALDIAGLERTLVLSAGTDGTDGPTDAAGAMTDGSTMERAIAAGLNARRALDENDAYPFFDKLGDLIRTGPTGTNVMDVHVVLVG